jgi:hypothetical protein
VGVVVDVDVDVDGDGDGRGRVTEITSSASRTMCPTHG